MRNIQIMNLSNKKNTPNNPVSFCRTKERQFSNTLSYFLLLNGYCLIFDSKSMKKDYYSSFFSWSGIITPFGQTFLIERNKQIICNMLTAIEHYFISYSDFEIHYSDVFTFHFICEKVIFTPMNEESYDIKTIYKLTDVYI